MGNLQLDKTSTRIASFEKYMNTNSNQRYKSGTQLYKNQSLFKKEMSTVMNFL